MNLLDKNIESLKRKNLQLAEDIINSGEGTDYLHTETSKTGLLLPVLKNGKHLHSKYDPLKEAERLFTGNENFVLFCGLGAGIHIEYFLTHFKLKHCAVTETDFANLKSLFKIMDFSNLIINNNLTFLPPLESENFEKEFISSYIPALHGNFEIKILRPWEDFYKEKMPEFEKKIQNSLEKIQADVSTQAAFGKIWMRNIMHNLKTAALIRPSIPKPDTRKKAYILGAGPSLEFALKDIKKERNKIVLFASDTAFPVLMEEGVEADFFVSMDPQNISYAHCFKPFTQNTIGIFDLCANPILAREFLKNGNAFFFTKSDHPFAQFASLFSPFPYMETASGTVALAAGAAACAMGFKDLNFEGLDFAYTDGKTYATGTYLSKRFENTSLKTSPLETKFCDLMFRTQVEKTEKQGKITYTTALLDSYKSFFLSKISFFERRSQKVIWNKDDFSLFPYTEFISYLKNSIDKDKQRLTTALLPYFAYLSKRLSKNMPDFADLELVLSQILEYTIN
ncbi:MULTISPECIES: motility associated factor glycosyltransferase family protein [unclassified Treponema]|uniref:motility associated factor glycosyltransferase family protein n=1 Tax=unclassified Treponema TaxID=2638727 RepID=UPI0020A50EEB|nr:MULTISPECIES: 6-hydroxymethylpterin diphosphokinase MptE-like protein [unclassified Treponema]UTC68165.1 motility associated factor glycosyltransferase family protein [Treponema sp. OMZ 789]UTC70885.1 motility associated factor glycosyltransferase family protein [Treponema sp. OMZ 790]UTC73625.1 motility associated factor glycosyltransferase family protein [Treponema sp. OMZ 791]